MRAVIQRVKHANVVVDGVEVGAIGSGIMALVASGEGDSDADADYIANKIADLRIFEDTEGKMNLTVGDIDGSVLVISQFTLYGDCRKGRRPSFVKAMEPVEANRLVELVKHTIKDRGLPVQSGVFAADMKVSLLNDGPVTLLLDSSKSF